MLILGLLNFFPNLEGSDLAIMVDDSPKSQNRFTLYCVYLYVLYG
jgi:hypothetical protein